MRVRPDTLTVVGWTLALVAAVLFGLGHVRVAGAARPAEALLAGLAMTFSLLTSYARARAEGLNVPCELGLLERAGRVVILSAFSMFGLLTPGVALVAAGALVTTAQRVLHVHRATRG